jgi:phosphoribosyl-ATP pyrophosphohydrolase
LFAGGTEKIAAKVMEEAHEAVEEARNADPARLAAESADLIYHLMVMWAEQDVRPEDVWEELARREGTSGHAEKAARKRD